MKILTKEQQESSEDVKIRSIRKEKLICKNRKYKVRNQCHYKGEYRGASHSICNLKYSVNKKIPIAFHN